MMIKNFQDFDIWKLSMSLSVDIYELALVKAIHKDYSLMDQMRRSSISISSNIAEGFERNSKREFIRFLKIAKGSAGELRSQIILALRLKYIEADLYNELESKALIISSKIASLISHIQRTNN